VVGALLHRRHRGFDLAHRRDDDDLDQRLRVLDDLEQVEPAHPGEPDVEQHQVDARTRQHRLGGFGARFDQYVVVALEDGGERVAHPLVVIDDEQRFRRSRHGGAASPGSGAGRHSIVWSCRARPHGTAGNPGQAPAPGRLAVARHPQPV
jgi:hypothetical protein